MKLTKADALALVMLTKWAEWTSELLTKFGFIQPTADKILLLDIRQRAEAFVKAENEREEAESKKKAGESKALIPPEAQG
jgi:hypothetical protein